MKKLIILIGCVLLLGIVFVFSQVPGKIIKNESKSESRLIEEDKLVEKYVSRTIIQGKWGIEPGEFGMTMWEGEPDFPRSMVIDIKGNIFILDTFNNRIQKFDKEGKYIASISVESYQRSTKQEVEKSKNTWNKIGFDFPTIYAKTFYIDQEDNLYLAQERKDAVTGESHNKFFKYTKTGQKVEIDQSALKKIEAQAKSGYFPVKSKDGKYLVELGAFQGQVQNIKVRNLETNEVQNISFNLKYSDTKIGFIKVDRYNRIYVFTAYPPQIHVYNVQGNLLSVVDLYGFPNPYGKHPSLSSVPYIDNNGNIYQMELIPNPDKQIENFPAYSLGLKIIKWEVRE